MVPLAKGEKFKVVVSDCHLSAGRFFEGKLNPHEDFHFDDEMCDLFHYFSSGEFAHRLGRGAVDVELVLGGDFFDYLNVPYKGEFEVEITEEIALYKTEAIIAGHPKVMSAIKKFASLPNKRVTYLIGNHDADLFFPKVRERIIQEWDPEGKHPSEKVRVVTETDRILIEEGVEIHHGNQHEIGNELDFQRPFRMVRGKKILNLPWSSIYVLKIINRLKWEREYIDKIRPVKAFVFFGMIFDPLFTLKFVFLTSYYFVKTRLSFSGSRFRFKDLFTMVRHETKFFQDLEDEAREVLNNGKKTQTVIFGHTHRPMDKVYPDGKQYINTGTWTKMIQVDWQGLGQQFRRTFALIRIKDGKADCELRQWVGEHSPHQPFGG